MTAVKFIILKCLNRFRKFLFGNYSDNSQHFQRAMRPCPLHQLPVRPPIASSDVFGVRFVRSTNTRLIHYIKRSNGEISHSGCLLQLPVGFRSNSGDLYYNNIRRKNWEWGTFASSYEVRSAENLIFGTFMF